MSDPTNTATSSPSDDRVRQAPTSVDPGPVSLPSHEENEGAYRPLSLLAVAGFCLAVVYALVVNLGGLYLFASLNPRFLVLLIVVTLILTVVVARTMGIRDSRRLARFSAVGVGLLLALIGMISLVAYSGSNPWVLPMWIILVPVVAAVMCWMARARIQAAEGTLAGMELANWGLGLTLFFGLNYTAYLTSNYFAVRQQATDTADRWLQAIKEGQLQEAFLLVLPVSARPNDPSTLREEIEVRYNTPRGGADDGQFSLFSHSFLVRQILLSGPDTKIELTRISPRYEQGNYRVELEYLITTKYGKFNLDVFTNGTESVGSSGAGRQWQISSETIQITGQEPTPLGLEMQAAINKAGQLAISFTKALQESDPEKAYLLTLPEDQRDKQEKAGKRLRAAESKSQADMLALLATDDEAKAYNKGLAAFKAGNLIDTKSFWADVTFQKDLLRDVKNLFRAESVRSAELTVMQAVLPLGTWVDGQYRTSIPFTIKVSEPNGNNRFRMEADVVVSSPAEADKVPQGPWHVTKLNLLRGHSAAPPRR